MLLFPFSLVTCEFSALASFSLFCIFSFLLKKACSSKLQTARFSATFKTEAKQEVSPLHCFASPLAVTFFTSSLYTKVSWKIAMLHVLCSHFPFGSSSLESVLMFSRTLFSCDFYDTTFLLFLLLLPNIPSQSCLPAHLFLPFLKMLAILRCWDQSSLPLTPLSVTTSTPMVIPSQISMWLSFLAPKSFLNYRFLYKLLTKPLLAVP